VHEPDAAGEVEAAPVMRPGVSTNYLYRVSLWLRRRTEVGSILGMVGALISGLTITCCFGFTGVATLAMALGLGVMSRFEVAYPIIFSSMALQIAALLLSLRRHRRPYPLALSLVGLPLVAYPLYHSLEVWLWLTLLYTGLGFLAAASALEVWICRRWCRR